MTLGEFLLFRLTASFAWEGLHQEGVKFSFFLFHFFLFFLPSLVVVTQKVQNAVDDKEKNFFLGFFTDLFGLALRGLGGDDHVAQDLRGNRSRRASLHRERDDIGGTIAAKISAVQAGDFIVIDDQEVDFGVFISQGA